MSEERPLTRRELRLKRLAEQEASRGDVQPAAAPTSPERVLTRKELRALRLQSAAEIAQSSSEDALDAKLRAAGIVASQASAQSVLERLKAQRGAA